VQPIDVYLMYCAMKAHFSKGDYDFVKFGGKTKVSRDSFWKRKDRHFFVRISKKYKDEVQDYLLANFIVENKGWIGNFSDENYNKWKDRMSRLETLFENEASILFKNASLEILSVPENSHPKLLKEYLGKRISLETMVILDGIFDYSSKWDKKMSDDIMWPDVKKLIENYKKFLTYPHDSCKMVVIKLTTME